MIPNLKFKYILRILCFTTILFSCNLINAQKGVRIGYIDMNVILDNVSEYKKSIKILDDRIIQWKKEIEQKKNQLSQFQNQLNAEKVLLTPELISDREIEINDYANEIIALQEKRFGPNGDRIKQRRKLITPIQDQVLIIVQQIAEEKKEASMGRPERATIARFARVGTADSSHSAYVAGRMRVAPDAVRWNVIAFSGCTSTTRPKPSNAPAEFYM